MKAQVVKLEPYPDINPTGIAVGFNLIFDNGRISYVDTIVDISLEGDEAISTAWSQLENHINNKQLTVGNLPPAIGRIWNPTEGHIETDVVEEPVIVDETEAPIE